MGVGSVVVGAPDPGGDGGDPVPSGVAGPLGEHAEAIAARVRRVAIRREARTRSGYR